jgi:hypothetical protein
MELTDVVSNYYRKKKTLFTEPIISKDIRLHKQETIYFLHIFKHVTRRKMLYRSVNLLYITPM